MNMNMDTKMAEPSAAGGGDTVVPNILHISDLPDGFLADVVTYLSKPSRAIFAVAMTAPASTWCKINIPKPSAMSKVIMSSSDWSELDFADAERSLAKKLTDDDLGAILQCVILTPLADAVKSIDNIFEEKMALMLSHLRNENVSTRLHNYNAANSSILRPWLVMDAKREYVERTGDRHWNSLFTALSHLCEVRLLLKEQSVHVALAQLVHVWPSYQSLVDEMFAAVGGVAARGLKTLKLTGCVNILGRGLEPLRASTCLQQIDLSLVKEHESPDIQPDPLISRFSCLPILGSICDKDGNKLRHVQFPKKWSRRGTGAMREFLEKYNTVLSSRGSSCSRCPMIIDSWWFDNSGHQLLTCYKCTKIFCNSCRVDNLGPNWNPLLWQCYHCEKHYCADCVKASDSELCGVCQLNLSCKECVKSCDGCGIACCGYCLNTCECCGCAKCEYCVEKCENCPKSNCEGCFDGENYSVKHCSVCDRKLCSYCRVGDCSMEGGGTC